jgi:hypothetical protein
MLVFAYWLTGVSAKEPSSEIHVFRGQCYAFAFAPASQYAELARNRSPKWQTVSVPRGSFRELVAAGAAGVTR